MAQLARAFLAMKGTAYAGVLLIVRALGVSPYETLPCHLTWKEAGQTVANYGNVHG